jgi:hypothetical protein
VTTNVIGHEVDFASVRPHTMTSERPQDFELDRPSEIGVHSQFWSSAATEVPVSLPPPPAALTPEQVQRRARLRRIVVGVVAGLSALAIVSGIVSLGRRKQALASLSSPVHATPPVAQPVAAPPPVLSAAEPAVTAPAVPVAAAPSVLQPAAAVFDWRAFSLAPAADADLLGAWSAAVPHFQHADFVVADHALARATNKGDVAQREAARFARAVLWRANGYPRAARGALVHLADHAQTPLVRDGARKLLAAK